MIEQEAHTRAVIEQRDFNDCSRRITANSLLNLVIECSILAFKENTDHLFLEPMEVTLSIFVQLKTTHAI